MNADYPGELAQLANTLYRRGFNDEEVLLQLREKGAAETMLDEIIRQVKSARSTKRRSTGFFCCGIGVALLVIGCMLTILLYNSGENIRWVMYGLTSIGIVFTVKGMIDLMGW